METIEIYVVTTHNKETKTKNYYYYLKRDSALKKALELAKTYSKLTVTIHPSNLITK